MKKHKAKKHAKKNKGFSLIELLIVVAIILIIAAIAIPNLLRSRIAANEASAVGSVRTITTAEITYSTTYPATGFAALASLGGSSCTTPTSTSACLIDQALATASSTTALKSGYYFATPVASATDFVVGARPGTPGTSGVRAFCSSTDGVVRGHSPDANPADVATCQGWTAL
jgi:type IV pilus assembly protein PilA